MAQSIRVQFGHMSYRPHQVRVMAFAIDQMTRATTKMQSVFNASKGMYGGGTIFCNGRDAAHGQFYRSAFDVVDGDIIVFRYISKFAGATATSNYLVLRARDDAPLHTVRPYFPHVSGGRFINPRDIVPFIGHADILTQDDITTLGFDDSFTEYDWERCFDRSDVDDVWEIQTIGGSAKPKFTKVVGRDGRAKGVVLPTMPTRRLRVQAPEPVKTRRRRRRRK